MVNFLKLSFVVLCFCFQVKAQNLILNASFEEYTKCPEKRGQIEYCKYWYSAGNTPDFYHKCGYYKMENVTFDYTQDPFDGQGVCGIGISFPFRLRSDTIFREYVMGTLKNKIPDGAYFMKLHILSQPSNRTNNLGVYFTSDTIPKFDGYAKNITPQLQFNEWIGSYPNWKRHTGCVENITNSKYFTIGNFNKPGTDSVEFPDINFSNIIHFDDLGLFKIPEYTKVDTTIVGNYCVILDSVVNEIPIYHTLNGDTIHDRICIETLGKHTVRSFVKGCDKIIKEINIDIINCNSTLVCSNVTLRKNEEIELRCTAIDSNELSIRSLSLYDRWGNLLFQQSNPDIGAINIPKFVNGVFMYKMEYKICGQLFTKIGDVTILE
jgi:hypothetical protein